MSGVLSLLPRMRPRPGAYLADASEVVHEPHSELIDLVSPQPEHFVCGRKLWEWDYIATCARALGLLNGESRAVGLGAGSEPLMFYFARHCGSVVGTDLYSGDSQWQEARGEIERVYERAEFDYPRERLRIYSADMRAIPEPTESFDFVWSCGSIEHLFTLFGIYRAYCEMHRLLKPGGYALVTTEYCLANPPYLLTGLNALDDHLFDSMIRRLGGLELVGPVSLEYNWIHPGGAPQPRSFILSPPPTRLYGGYVPRDFIHLVGLSAITPIGFVLRKTGQPMIPWEDLPLARPYRIFDGVRTGGDAASNVAALRSLLAIGLPKQAELLVRAHLLDLVCGDPSQGRDAALDELNGFLKAMPQGSLQDPNLLRLVASRSIDLGQLDTALDVLVQALLSPNNLPADCAELGRLLVAIFGKLGKTHKIRPVFQTVLLDLLARGFPLANLEELLFRDLANEEVSRELNLILDDAIEALRGTVMKATQRVKGPQL